MRWIFVLTMTFILSMTALSNDVFAQEGPSDTSRQVYVFYGKVLPNGVPGIEEIFSLWGLKYSQSMGQDKSIFSEFAFTKNGDSQVEWLGGSISLRMDVPIETYVAIAFIGVDYTRYNVPGEAAKDYGGVHGGGGLMAHIGGNAHFRFDMKLNSKPGTSLMFGLGFVFEI